MPKNAYSILLSCSIDMVIKKAMHATVFLFILSANFQVSYSIHV
jgi:hypothetical protein